MMRSGPHASFRVLVVLVGLLVITGCAVSEGWAAATPAGTVISNFVTGDYKDTNGNDLPKVTSNTVTTTVAQVELPVGADGTLASTPSIVAGQVVSIEVEDPDLNTDPERVETITLETRNPRTGEVETRVYTETGPDTGVFTAQVGTTFGEQAGADHDGVFHVRGGDMLVTTYQDARTSTGGTSTQTATTRVLETVITLEPNPDVIVANGTDVSWLTSRVTDENGRPLPDGTPVTFTTDQGTLENGGQTITAPIVGGNGEATTMLTAPVLTVPTIAVVQAIFGGVASDIVRLTVLPGAVSMRVFDAKGKTFVRAGDPNVDVQVIVRGIADDGTPVERVVTVDAMGVYAASDLPPGTYQVYTVLLDRATGKRVLETTPQSIRVDSGGKVSPGKNTVNGTIRSRHDPAQTFAFAYIELFDEHGTLIATTQADAEGRYTFDGMTPGKYYIIATTPDQRKGRFDVPPITQSAGLVVIHADALIDPFGIVFNARTGAGVPGVTVVIVDPQTGEALPIPGLQGTGAFPNVNNVNPFVTDAAGMYAFLFGSHQVGRIGQPVRYELRVTPPEGMDLLPRSIYIDVAPVPGSDPATPLVHLIAVALDRLPLSEPERLDLAEGAIEVPNIETVALNIPLFSTAPPLRVSKIAPDSLFAGQEAIYRIAYRNNSARPVNGLVVFDEIPEGATFVESSGGGIFSDGAVTWEVGTVPAGAADTLQLVVRLDFPLPMGTKIVNRAVVSGEGVLPVYDKASTTVRLSPVLEIVKRAAADSVRAGGTVDYTIVVRNVGDGAATAVTVSDTLPQYTALISASEGAISSDGTVRWSPGTLEPGETDSLYLRVNVQFDLPVSGALENVGSVRSAESIQVRSAPAVVAAVAAVPSQITLVPDPARIIGNGKDLSILTATVKDSLGHPVPDGVPVVFETTGGTFENGEQRIVLQTKGGVVFTTLRADVVSTEIVRALARATAGTERSGKASAEVEIIFFPSAVAGTVVEYGTGRAIEGAVVVIEDDQGHFVGADTTASDGAYLIPVARSGLYTVRITVSDRFGRRVTSVSTVFVEVPGQGGLPPVRNWCAISGLTLDALNGLPIEEAGTEISLYKQIGGRVAAKVYGSVYAQQESGRDSLYAITTTDSTGSYMFSFVVPGTYRVHARYRGQRFYGNGDIVVSDVAEGMCIFYADIPLRRVGHLSLSKTGPDTAAVGSRFQYALIYANNGAADALNVALVDTLPPEVSLVSAGAGGSASGSIVRWALGNLRVGEQDTVFVQVEVQSSLLKDVWIANTAHLSADALEPARASAHTMVPAFPRLALTKTAEQDTVRIGGTLDYTLVVQNIGNARAWNVTVVDTLPPDLDLIAASGQASHQHGILRWPVGDLSSGEADTLRITTAVATRVADGQRIANRAWGTAENAEAAPDSAVVIARGEPDLWISKGADLTEGRSGETVTYTIVVGNRGTADAREVTVEDRLPSLLQYIEERAPPEVVYVPKTRTLSWSPGTVARGAADTLTFQIRIGGDLTPGVHRVENTAQLLIRGAPIAFSNTVTLSVLVPYLKIEKSVNRTVVEPGDIVRYQVTVTNASASDSVYEVQIEDHLPHSVTYMPGTTLVDGHRAGDPSGVRPVTWAIGDLGPSESRTVLYLTVVGADAESGDGVNKAIARGRATGGFSGALLQSEPARKKVRIRPSLFAPGEIILGKVWVDTNGNRIHDHGERTVSGVVLMLEDGTRVTTDEYGNYSVPEIKPGEHVIWLLEESLPPGLRPMVSENAFAGDPRSQFVSLPKYAMAKANFMLVETAVPLEKPAVREMPVGALTLVKRVIPERVSVPMETEVIRIGATYFRTGSAQICPEMQSKLKEVCAHLIDARRIRIEGHTDIRPIRTRRFPSNQELSEARAQAVRTFLSEVCGIEPERMTAMGYAATRPIASNRTQEGRAQNRRVDVIAEYEPPEPKVTVTYELTVRWSGEAPVRAVALVDSLPSQAHVLEETVWIEGVEATVQMDAQGRMVWDLGDLSREQEVRVRFDVEVEEAGLDSLVNRAYLRYGTDSPSTGNRVEAILYIDRE